MRIKQDASYEGGDRWKWSVWVDAPDEELQQVEYVEYTLHPTFPDPVRHIEDRKTRFRLESSGWGEFTVRALVVNKKGDKKYLHRWLRLEYPNEQSPEQTDRSGAPETSDQPHYTYFLSCAIGDAPFANTIAKALIALGARVLMVADEPSNLPWESSIERLLDQSDLALFIISDDVSIWMRREIEAAAKRETPIIPVVIAGSKVKLSELPQGMERAIQIKPLPPEQFAEESQDIASRIQKAAQAISQKISKKKTARR